MRDCKTQLRLGCPNCSCREGDDIEICHKYLAYKQGKEDVLKSAIPIPKGATNGDMIKAMFPNIRIENFGKALIIFGMASEGDMYVCFDLDWWNAPYKREEQSECVLRSKNLSMLKE